MEYFDHAMQSEAQIELKPRLTASYSSRQFEGAAFDLIDSLFDPEKVKRIRYKCEAQWQENLRSQNVIGYLPAAETSDSFLVLTAHYDHLGKMGDAIFYGANDNASGVAMLLELARYYAEHPEKRPFNLLFIAFGGEEAGLVGSRHYVQHPLVSLSKMRFLLNLDLMGNGEDGITVVNGTVFEKEMNVLERLNDKHHWLSNIKRRGAAANSDHYPFSERGVPSFFFYTMGGKPWYHDIYDRPEDLTFEGFEPIMSLIKAFFEEM
jgi:Zn-dependent M28 family amino/carboxypeptidase